MAMIGTMLAALTAAASCPVPVGEPVVITSAPLALETLGGSYRTDTGWRAPSEARIGELRHDWALMPRSNDPRFADFDLSPGPVHSRSSGCWFQWDNAYAGGSITGISNARIGTSGYREGYTPPTPVVTPTITGYRFATAIAIHRGGFVWVGVWNADGAVERSQIVAFNDGRYRILATLPVRLGGIAQLPDLHSAAYHLTLIGEGRPDRPVAWMRLIWFGNVPNDH